MADQRLEVVFSAKNQLTPAIQQNTSALQSLEQQSARASTRMSEVDRAFSKNISASKVFTNEIKRLGATLIGPLSLVGALTAVIGRMDALKEAQEATRKRLVESSDAFREYRQQVDLAAKAVDALQIAQLAAQGKYAVGPGELFKQFRLEQMKRDGLTGSGASNAFTAEMQMRAYAELRAEHGGGMGARFATDVVQRRAEEIADREGALILVRERNAKDDAERIAFESRVVALQHKTYFDMQARFSGSGWTSPAAGGGQGLGLAGPFLGAGAAAAIGVGKGLLGQAANLGQATMLHQFLGIDPARLGIVSDMQAMAAEREAAAMRKLTEATEAQRRADATAAEVAREYQKTLADLNAETERRSSFLGAGADGTSGSGFLGGMGDALNQGAHQGQQGYAVGQGAYASFVNSMSGALNDFTLASKSAGEAFEAFGRSFVGSLVQMANQVLANQVAQMLFGSLFGGPAGSPGFASATGSGSMGGQFALGAAFHGGHQITAFASGGVVSKPTVFPMANGLGLMGEAGPEAVMPLARDSSGRLGVRAQGGGGATIIIQAMDGADVARVLSKHADVLFGLMQGGMTSRPGFRHSMMGGV